jgi:hypothetical protein
MEELKMKQAIWAATAIGMTWLIDGPGHSPLFAHQGNVDFRYPGKSCGALY